MSERDAPLLVAFMCGGMAVGSLAGALHSLSGYIGAGLSALLAVALFWLWRLG